MTVASTAESSAIADRALARAVLCRALKVGLDEPTDLPRQAFFDDDAREALRQAAYLLEDGRTGALGEAVERLCAMPAPSIERLWRSYERLFGHTLRGRVCPYECEYGRHALLQQAQELADLTGFYAAFGLRCSETKHERSDHVACELEFLEFLSRKECWARGNEDEEMAKVTGMAATRFLRDHLARFGRAFARSLQEAEPRGFYGLLGGVCEAFLLVECERLGVAIGPEVLELASAEPDNVPMACGSDGADGLLQIGDPAQPGPRRTEPT